MSNDEHNPDKPLTMGALVQAPVCTGCDAESNDDEWARGVALGTAWRRNPGGAMELTSGSLVPAPKCTECRSDLEPISSTKWCCVTRGCGQEGQLVVAGVYPVRRKVTR